MATTTTRRTITAQPRFDEADVLRAAALIRNELDDRRCHQWTDLVDGVRDLTDGARRAGSELSWLALTLAALPAHPS